MANKEVDSSFISLISSDFSILLCRRFESDDKLKTMYFKRKLGPSPGDFYGS